MAQAVKSTDCSSRGSGFSSHHRPGSSQLSVNSSSRESAPAPPHTQTYIQAEYQCTSSNFLKKELGVWHSIT